MDSAPYTLIAAWIAYGVLHSLLASLWLKARVASLIPSVIPAYRLFYNLFALLTLIPVAVIHYRIDPITIWEWNGPLRWILDLIALTALIGLLASFRCYDSGEFSGLAQWRNRRTHIHDDEGFKISPYHRFVRHPWYSFTLVIIWTRDMNSTLLTSACMISLYFWVGSLSEERKLVAHYGKAYRTYRTLVPGLIPVPWKFLSKTQAEKLAKSAD